MVERDLAKVDVAGSTPVSRSNFNGRASRPRSCFHPAIGRGTQVVRERSAKPLYVGSIPDPRLQFSFLPVVPATPIPARPVQCASRFTEGCFGHIARDGLP